MLTDSTSSTWVQSQRVGISFALLDLIYDESCEQELSAPFATYPAHLSLHSDLPDEGPHLKDR